MSHQIIINSRSSGKFREMQIGGRSHVVTEMISIKADSVMNRIYYSPAAVEKSYRQLDHIPVPVSHPKIDGKYVSAYHPLAINTNHVGAFALDPRLENDKVINDLAIDVEVAEKYDLGVEALRRIRAGESIGVSTALNGTLTMVNGERHGVPYDATVDDIKFDHIAMLFNEPPAGETYTINSDEYVVICNIDDSVNDLRDQLQALVTERLGGTVHDILLNPDSVIVDVSGTLQKIPFNYDDQGRPVLTGIGTRVKRVTSFEGNSMDVEKLALAIIGNSGNRLTIDDRDRLVAMTEVQLVNALHEAIVKDVTLERAKEVCEANKLAVNAAADVDGLADYVAHRDEFVAFQTERATQRKKKIDAIIANSNMTEADVAALDDDAIDRLSASVVPNQDYSAAGGDAPKRRTSSSVVAVDFSQ